MTREQRIVETFVELADTMVDDFDVLEFLHRLTERCVELLDCAEAGLLLADAAGTLRVMASSSERSEALELLETQNDEGPCFECYQHGRAMFSEDLRAAADRWPRFAPAAVEKGFRSVQAVPMRVRGETIGALNLFRADAGRLTERDVPLGQGMADVAAIALLQERAVREARGVVEQLQGALRSRVMIEQAKGVLAERAQVGVDVAFARLRAHARTHNLRLSAVARDVIDGRLDASLTVAEPGSSTSER
ncbi:GAF and ANTAR domain-containing protein [Conexibacter woesei]|uniref:ANTAR domain-containing protein n=1 Tax=Conexibacter woesei (strain DSM 14684 / CCUG 47730 / CIP 108061 / JCM 11494 / NBRC 100937 / ID131577) TaxID=469383 RepID=D3FDU9_CONWI|nr:GAF and ANTAR domain-containing protein [Conexibacter woesei]ADB51565.1 ANTAR domain protein with unknown sensor [Conexibacter woesei DSM 14684]